MNAVKNRLLKFLMMLMGGYVGLQCAMAQGNMVTYLNAVDNPNVPPALSTPGLGNARLSQMFALSDGTILAAGQVRVGLTQLQANSLNINIKHYIPGIPATVTPVQLDTAGIKFDATSRNYAFIMRLSSDMKNILNVVHFPYFTVGNVFKIRTNALPGQATGDLYISGVREEAGSKGYYIAKLDNNFINGEPTGIVWYKEMRALAGGENSKIDLSTVDSWHLRAQPWDVTSDGRVIYGYGEEFAFNWVEVSVLSSEGTDEGVYEGFPSQTMIVSYAGDTNQILGDSGWATTNFESSFGAYNHRITNYTMDPVSKKLVKTPNRIKTYSRHISPSSPSFRLSVNLYGHKRDTFNIIVDTLFSTDSAQRDSTKLDLFLKGDTTVSGITYNLNWRIGQIVIDNTTYRDSILIDTSFVRHDTTISVTDSLIMFKRYRYYQTVTPVVLKDTIVTVDVARRILSRLTVKHGGTSWPSMRSKTQEDYDFNGVDENGNYRKGKQPLDFMYEGPCTALEDGCDNVGFNPTTGYGKQELHTSRINDIVIDRRTNEVYYSVTIPLASPYPTPNYFNNSADFQSYVAKIHPTEGLKWYAYLHELDTNKVKSSGATQFVDYLGIDYANDMLVIAARTYDTSANNLWNGDAILNKPGGQGFQNKFTGTKNLVERSWLGKYGLNNGQIYSATYVGEYDAAGNPSGTVIGNAKLDGWQSPNSGNPDLGYTFITGMHVNTNGSVVILGNTVDELAANRATAARTITTSDAFQKMYKPDTDAYMDSLSSRNAFVRVYTEGLDGIVYSSLLTGRWNPITGQGGGNTILRGVLGTDSGVVVTGFHDGLGNDIPTFNSPAFGKNTMTKPRTGATGRRESAIFAKMLFDKPVSEEPIAISGPDTLRVDSMRTYTVSEVAGAAGYGWLTDTTIMSGASTGTTIDLTGLNRGITYVMAYAMSENGPGIPRAIRVMVDTTPATDVSYANDLRTRFVIYPNPTEGVVKIESDLLVQSIELTDIMGRKVLIEGIKSGIDIKEMNMQHLPSGLYILKVHTNEGQAYFKLKKD